MENFEKSIAEILEVEKIELTDELDSFEAWDSMALLCIVAYCDEQHNITLSVEEIDNAETISGLKELILSKI